MANSIEFTWDPDYPVSDDEGEPSTDAIYSKAISINQYFKGFLYFYPRGDSTDNEDYISVYFGVKQVKKASGLWGAKIRYGMTLRCDRKRGKHHQRFGTKVFSDTCTEWGYPRFILLSELDKYLMEDEDDNAQYLKWQLDILECKLLYQDSATLDKEPN